MRHDAPGLYLPVRYGPGRDEPRAATPTKPQQKCITLTSFEVSCIVLIIRGMFPLGQTHQSLSSGVCRHRTTRALEKFVVTRLLAVICDTRTDRQAVLPAQHRRYILYRVWQLERSRVRVACACLIVASMRPSLSQRPVLAMDAPLLLERSPASSAADLSLFLSRWGRAAAFPAPSCSLRPTGVVFSGSCAISLLFARPLRLFDAVVVNCADDNEQHCRKRCVKLDDEAKDI